MPRSLNARIAARGFKSYAADGETGAGSLWSQGSTTDPQHGEHVGTSAPSQVLTGYAAEPVAALDGTPLLVGTWGLPGSPWQPDDTPLTHAAPVPGWAGSYQDHEALAVMHDKSAAIHAQDFGALNRHTALQGVDEATWDQWSSNEPGENVLAPVTGQLRVMGGRDTTQGYDLRNRYGFDAGHRERHTATDPQPMFFLDPAERPFVVPQVGVNATFTPTDTVQGPNPVGQFRDAGDINSTDPTAYTPPAEPDSFNGTVASGPVSAGWW